MENINASQFKTHFGEVLDRASEKVIRIHRRGRKATVILSAEAYDSLRRRAATAADEGNTAMERLVAFARRQPFSTEALKDDLRGAAILRKHTRHWKS